MLDRLRTLFSPDNQASPPTEREVQLAAATLMFEMIRSDGAVDQVELDQMQTLLQTHSDISGQEIDEFMIDARKSAESAISLQGFTRQICEQWDNQQRLQLLENLWVLALADEVIDANERHLVRKIAGLLYMTDRQINIAKESAKQRLGL